MEINHFLHFFLVMGFFVLYLCKFVKEIRLVRSTVSMQLKVIWLSQFSISTVHLFDFLFSILLFRLMVKFMFTGKELLKLSLHLAEASSMRMVMWHQ